jgi:G:T-mismatch repair DNA endonuclease (very short patch repair protein)
VSGPNPDEVARQRRDRRRSVDLAIAWSRHKRTAAAQQATGGPGRAYNRLEARLAKLLEAAGVDYRWQFPLGTYVYDFLLPDRTLVEVHGTYWHADPRRYDPKTFTPTQRRNLLHDVDKKFFAASKGYRLKVVWEADLNKRGVTLDDLLEGRRCKDEGGGWPEPDSLISPCNRRILVPCA